MTSANIPITATAADSDGTVSSVKFYQGATLLGTVTSSPYSYTWNTVANGNYSLTVVATDNNNVTTTSSAIAISSAAIRRRPASITAPTNGTTYTAPASITITASAAGHGGATISSVKFYAGGTLLTTVTTSPYTYTWTSVAAGSYALTAQATDNHSLTTTSSAVNVVSDAPPTVSITAPANNAVFPAPASSITITASASSSGGTISTVQF